MLVAREANKGLYENFGQDEVSKIKDVFIDSSSYTDEMNRNRDKVNNFSNWCSSYNGQQWNKKNELEHNWNNSKRKKQGSDEIYKGNIKKYDANIKNPKSIQFFSSGRPQDSLHPTQKPVPLLEYLIKTYTFENETVLDFTMGSGSWRKNKRIFQIYWRIVVYLQKHMGLFFRKERYIIIGRNNP